MKYIYHIEDNGNHIKCEHSNIDDCMNELMKHLFNILGNGDNENDGMGSLWRCSQFIYDTIRNGNVYKYANCKFWVEFVDEPKEKVKHFRITYSAVVHNSIVIPVRDYKDLKESREFYEKSRINELKCLCNGVYGTWQYDGNIKTECEEEIK